MFWAFGTIQNGSNIQQISKILHPIVFDVREVDVRVRSSLCMKYVRIQQYIRKYVHLRKANTKYRIPYIPVNNVQFSYFIFIICITNIYNIILHIQYIKDKIHIFYVHNITIHYACYRYPHCSIHAHRITRVPKKAIAFG